jgi:lipoprotein-releasing system ATP-binding protein
MSGDRVAYKKNSEMDNDSMSAGHTAATMRDLAAPGSRDTPGRVILEACALHKSYRTGAAQLVVLAAVDLKLVEGEMVAIMAPSGAGKSTLLHLLAALDTPTSGTVYFDSKPIESNAPAAVAQFRNRAVGFVWQRHHLLPDFTAIENVALPLLLRGDPAERARQIAGQWLNEVGLSARTEHRTGELSGGEQQRVAIARALVTQPAILLADEPTGDLDEQNAVAVFDLIERLHRAHRLTSLIATHNVALAGRCDRVMSLEQGVLKLRGVGPSKMGSTSGGEKS